MIKKKLVQGAPAWENYWWPVRLYAYLNWRRYTHAKTVLHTCKCKCRCVEEVACLTFGWDVSNADKATAKEEYCPRGRTQCSLWLISTGTHTHSDTHMHTQSLIDIDIRGYSMLAWGGSSPSLIPVEISTAHPAECVSITAGHAVRGTEGRDFKGRLCTHLWLFIYIHTYTHI